MRIGVKNVVRGAIIASVYIVLTLLAWGVNLASGLIQARFSEALCVLPFFTFDAVLGLFIGCLLANTITGAFIYDIIFGSMATLLAALCSYMLSRSHFAKKHRTLAKWLTPLPAVVVNAFVVGWLLKYVYGLSVSYAIACAYVGAGQIIACYGAGMPLMYLLDRPSIKRVIFE